MTVYIVTWNLNREKPNYAEARKAFLEQLNHYQNIQDSGLESVRWISTSDTADQIDQFLRRKMDGNDRLFVSAVKRNEHQGWLDQKTWDWINSRL